MARLVSLSALLVSLAALTGCGQASSVLPEPPPAVDPRSGANLVGDAVQAGTLAFEPGAAALPPAELDTLRARLSPAVLGRDHLVRVAPATPGDRLSEARADWTMVVLNDAGVTVARSELLLAEPAGDRQGVVLEVHRARVGVPDCTSYPRALQARVDLVASARPLGCANTANLGRMVAEPADLLHGRALGPADGAPEAKAVEKYRAGGSKQEAGNPIAEAFAKAFGGESK